MASRAPVSGLLTALGLLAFALFELGQAIYLGRMEDFLFEQADYLYFFDSPFLFTTQFAVVAVFGYVALRWTRCEFRRWRGGG